MIKNLGFRGKAALVTAAALSGSLLATPALAAKDVIKDEKGDVWLFSFSEAEDPDTDLVKAGSVPNVDLRKVVVNHTRAAVKVSAKFTSFQRQQGFSGVSVAVSGPKASFYSFDVNVRGEQGRSRLLLQDLNKDDGRLRCPGARHRVSFAKDRITLSVPRSCIGRPAWVRHAVSAFSIAGPSAGELFVDAAGSKKPFAMRYSPRLRVG